MGSAFDNAATIQLLRVALAAGVAFLSGAFVQRVVLARFAIKIGTTGLELEDLSETDHQLHSRTTLLEDQLERLKLTVDELVRVSSEGGT